MGYFLEGPKGLNAGWGVSFSASALALWRSMLSRSTAGTQPRVMGTGFGVSPVVVLLSVLFWGWVLGAVGMLFAVPLTMAVRGALLGAQDARGAPANGASPPETGAPRPS